jgi:hypothetical protein
VRIGPEIQKLPPSEARPMTPLRDMTEPELRIQMADIANAIKARLPVGELFALIVFSDDQIGQYASNANRSDIIKSMREFADVLEAREDVPR